MIDPPPKQPRRRRRIIRDWRGLPARQVAFRHAAKRLGQLLYSAQRSGICVVTQAGKPVAVVLSAEHPLVRLIDDDFALRTQRLREPGGVFAFADVVFGSKALANAWMVQEIPALDGKRPLDQLFTEEGVEQVLNILVSIRHGFFA